MRAAIRTLYMLLFSAALGGVAVAQATGEGAEAAEKPIDPWREYILKQRWRDGESHFQDAIVTACGGDKLAASKRIASLHYRYNICRYFPSIERTILSKKERRDLMVWLLKGEDFNRELLLAIRPKDDPVRVFEIIDTLRRRAKGVKSYEQLSLAFAVAWDGFERNDKLLLDSYSYYVANSKRMTFNPRSLPYNVLKYVVDTQRPMEERQWALRNYNRVSDLRRVYLQPKYDVESVTYGKPTEISEHPYTLENIRKYGGVCHDRAIFASEIAKATGRPAVYMWGTVESGITHAWIGYLKTRGRGYEWNFDSGRIGDAETSVGRLREPQEGAVAGEHELDLALVALRFRPEQRRTAFIWCDVADILLKSGAKYAAAKTLEKSLNTCLCDKSQWRAFAKLAGQGAFSPKEVDKAIKKFTKELEEHPSLAVDAFAHLIEALGEKESKERLRWYGAMAQTFRKHIELVGRIRLMQGRYLEKTGKEKEAAAVYGDAALKAIKCRGVAVPLLDNASRLFLKGKKIKDAIALNNKAYYGAPGIKSDAHAVFATRFAVGVRLAKLHRLAGDRKAHDRLLKSICSHLRGDRQEREAIYNRLVRQTYNEVNTTTAP